MSECQLERVHQIDIQLTALKATEEQLAHAGLLVARENIRNHIKNAERSKRQMIMADRTTTEVFLRRRLADHQAMLEQQRLLTDINLSEADKKRSRRAADLIQRQIASKLQILRNLQATLERASANKVMHEYLGYDEKNAGGNSGLKRRIEMISKVASLYPLPSDQRNDFDWFIRGWDTDGIKTHGNQWPLKFMEKLKAVLDALMVDEHAFSKFMFDESRAVFGESKVLVVPGTLTALRALGPL